MDSRSFDGGLQMRRNRFILNRKGAKSTGNGLPGVQFRVAAERKLELAGRGIS
jgi:hypothetical protein